MYSYKYITFALISPSCRFNDSDNEESPSNVNYNDRHYCHCDQALLGPVFGFMLERPTCAAFEACFHLNITFNAMVGNLHCDGCKKIMNTLAHIFISSLYSASELVFIRLRIIIMV